jgi:CubicO group peptidase (beta-lactamase class C family)
MLDPLSLQSLLEEVRHKTGLPGLIATASSGEDSLHTAIGVASLDTGAPLTGECRFQLGCITKLLTSLLAVELSHEKVLDLKAPLAEYITEFKGIPKAQEIQIQHLASHTSGYQGLNIANPEIAYFYSWKKFAEFFSGAPQLFRPGTVFNYEHSECVILGEIIRRVTDTPTDEMMRQRIFEPLRLKAGRIKSDSSQPRFHVADHGLDASTSRFKTLRTVPYSAFWLSSLSDLTLSTSDLLVLGREMIDASRSKISREAILACRRPLTQVPATVGGAQREQMPLSFGAGCAEYAGKLWGHNGSARGQTCAFRFSPIHDLVIVVALNAWQPYLRDWIVNRIADAVRKSEPHSSNRAHRSDWKFDELEGTYTGCVQGTTLVAQAEPDKLTCQVTSKGRAAALVMEVTCDPEGCLAVKSEAPHLSLGFFREEDTDTPCMMLAMNAFKKVA